MSLLGTDTLAAVPAAVRKPAYDRSRLRIGMAHIGVGAFHRCHQAEHTDDMLEQAFDRWGVLGINLRPPRLAESLGLQDGLYSRTLRLADSAETRIIGSILEVIDAEDDAGVEAAIARLAGPDIEVVTMTLTEKGYCHIPATGALDPANEDIRHDLKGEGMPRTAPGVLAAALDRRRLSGVGGITLISCDNIPANGVILRNVLTAFARQKSPALAEWIEREVAFPSTMVDRIVPATSPADLAYAAEVLGVEDRGAVVGEPFRQWVIEDWFKGRRPRWDLAGAAFVADVTPYELIKMRVLNGAQSTLSHLGALCGHEYSYQAAADPLLAAIVRRMLVEETASTLPAVEGMPVPDYIDTTFRRIENTAIHHRCHQIGTDGSQKIVQRILNPLRERLARGESAELLILAAASWIAYELAGAARFGARWVPNDPWAATVMALGDRTAASYPALAGSVLALRPIFGDDLLTDSLAGKIGQHLEGLLSADPRAWLASVLARS